MQPYHPLEHIVGGVASAAPLADAAPRSRRLSRPRLYNHRGAQTGTSGTSVAQEVGRRLGWQVYDHELLERIAAEHGLRVSLLESLDERRQSWLVEWMEGFSQKLHVGETGYVHHLTQTILSLGAHGGCVIVGRGAGLLLAPATTLRVRLIGAGRLPRRRRHAPAQPSPSTMRSGSWKRPTANAPPSSKTISKKTRTTRTATICCLTSRVGR